MLKISDFSIDNGRLFVKEDSYRLSQIKSVRVVENQLSSHLVKAVVISVIASSILWLFDPFATPWGVSINAGLVALVITFPVALFLSVWRTKYQLQVEFDHQDEVGVQWVAVASGRKPSELSTFHQVEQNLNSTLAIQDAQV